MSSPGSVRAASSLGGVARTRVARARAVERRHRSPVTSPNISEPPKGAHHAPRLYLLVLSSTHTSCQRHRRAR
eukprot:599857-Prymnesium_polylepis.1